MGYCTVDDVLSLMPPVLTNSITDPDIMEKPINEIGIQYFIDYASEIIDGALSQSYVVPLVKIIIVNKNDQTEEETYPFPLSNINALLANAYIYKKLYSESQNPQELPEYSKDYQTQAFEIINQINSGIVNLKGQRPISRRYLRPESMNMNKLPGDVKGFGTGR